MRLDKKVLWRYERKYLIDYAEYASLSKICQKMLSRDPHAGDKGSYCVRSLYLDTEDNKNFFEKLDGLHTRCKLRIRTYGPGFSFIAFEAKHKEGDKIFKNTFQINSENIVEPMRQGKLLGWPAIEGHEQVNHYLCQDYYKSSTIIEYDREAYFDELSGVRLTFDTDLRAEHESLDLFDKNLKLLPMANANQVIFEVKYAKMPLWINQCLLRNLPLSRAISKYCTGKSLQSF